MVDRPPTLCVIVEFLLWACVWSLADDSNECCACPARLHEQLAASTKCRVLLSRYDELGDFNGANFSEHADGLDV